MEDLQRGLTEEEGDGDPALKGERAGPEGSGAGIGGLRIKLSPSEERLPLLVAALKGDRTGALEGPWALGGCFAMLPA